MESSTLLVGRSTVPTSAGLHLREARLRADASAPYPGIQPGRWVMAAALADQVLAGQLLRASGAGVRGRVLPDTDFEFRGGTATGGERQGMRPQKQQAALARSGEAGQRTAISTQ